MSRGKTHFLLVVFSIVLGMFAPTNAQAEACFHPQGNLEFGAVGDLNGSGAVNVADAVCGVLTATAIAANPASPTWPGCLQIDTALADVNCSGAVDIADVTLLILRAIGTPWVASVDSDGNGCADACAACVAPQDSSCLIGGACVPDSDANAANACQVCDAAQSDSAWTVLADGEDCGAGKICSAGACIETLADAPPTLSVTPADGALAVAFSAPASDGGSAILHYRAQCTVGPTHISTDGPTSPITVAGLANGTAYDCAVAATNAVGQGPFGSPLPGTPFGIPLPPTSVTATASTGQIAVAFSGASANGSAISAYSAACTSSTGGASGQQADPSSPIAVTGLTEGATYTCTVTATNAAGTSAPSAASNSVTVPVSALTSCWAHKQAGATTSGLYQVDTDAAGGNPPFTVLCDMVGDGGGWTLILRDTNSFDMPRPTISGAWSGSQGAAESSNLGLLAVSQNAYWALAPNQQIRLVYDNLPKKISRVCRRDVSDWWFLGDNVIYETDLGSCPTFSDLSFSPGSDIQFSIQAPKNETGTIDVLISQSGTNTPASGCPMWLNWAQGSPGENPNMSQGTAGVGDVNFHNGGGCYGVTSYGPSSATAYVR